MYEWKNGRIIQIEERKNQGNPYRWAAKVLSNRRHDAFIKGKTNRMKNWVTRYIRIKDTCNTKIGIYEYSLFLFSSKFGWNFWSFPWNQYTHRSWIAEIHHQKDLVQHMQIRRRILIMIMMIMILILIIAMKWKILYSSFFFKITKSLRNYSPEINQYVCVYVVKLKN